MRLVVDLTVCQGYAQCCFLAPEAFRLSGEEALLYDPAPDDTQRERILRAVAACPVRAIHINCIRLRLGPLARVDERLARIVGTRRSIAGLLNRSFYDRPRRRTARTWSRPASRVRQRTDRSR